MKKLIIALLALALTQTSCVISRKHKERSHTATKTDVKAVTTASVTATEATTSKDTAHVANVTTVETEIDTNIKTPGTSIAGSGALEDGEITLPDGSTFTWNIDTGKQTISLTASTPPSSIPVKLNKKQTTRSNTTAINSHTGHTEATQAATVNATASVATSADTNLKTKDVTAYSPPLGLIVGASIIIAALLLLWYIRSRTRSA